MSQIETGSIYKISFPNGKCYIGQSINPERRFRGHLESVRMGSLYPVHSAIREFGVENILFEILCTVPLFNLSKFELYYIKNESGAYNIQGKNNDIHIDVDIVRACELKEIENMLMKLKNAYLLNCKKSNIDGSLYLSEVDIDISITKRFFWYFCCEKEQAKSLQKKQSDLILLINELSNWYYSNSELLLLDKKELLPFQFLKVCLLSIYSSLLDERYENDEPEESELDYINNVEYEEFEIGAI